MKELDQWAMRLHRDVPLDRAIEIVAERMHGSDDEDHRYLASWLEGFLALAGRYVEAAQVLDEIIERDPDDVRFPIKKASLHLYFTGNLEESLRCIDHALERAYRAGCFRREALGVKARILLRLGRGQELTRVLEEIMSVKMMKGVADIGRERDFVDRAPPGMIPEDVLARYNAFRPKRPEDGTADEPPEWEPPEWE